ESADGRSVFVVPSDTLSEGDARMLGIGDEADFYGGIAPQPFMASKAITHGLLFPGAAAPEGWNTELGDVLKPFVLPGFTAFRKSEAFDAGLRLLSTGPIRVKDVHANAGAGQT